MTPLKIATRGSELAVWQAKSVASKLECDTELVVLSTRGDRDTASSLTRIGGQGVFVKEIQAAVIDGRADIAVHSAKDLPTVPVEALAIGAFPNRGDPRDALVGRSLENLKAGDVVATGSQRRQAQLKEMRPDLEFASLRGNMATRISQAGRYGAVVVAYAALERLGQLHEVAQVFDPDVLIPQAGQGALAVECRFDDEAVRALLATIDHHETRLAVEAERGLLAELGSGCSLPVGAYAFVDTNSGLITLNGFLGLPDSRASLRVSGSGDDSRELGSRLGKELLKMGGPHVLDELVRSVEHE